MKNERNRRVPLLLALALLMIGATSDISGCTGIFYTKGKVVLAGNNEDWLSPFSRIWFVPAAGKNFGRICFGFQEGGTQGAMNDQGLFIDGFALGPVEVKSAPGKPVYPGDLVQKALEECRTVAEAIALFERYDRQWLAASQMFVADKRGDSAIIEAEAIVRKQGEFQIVTNFRQSTVAPAAITDPRYLIARKMMSASEPAGVDLFRRILAAVHQEGKYPTQYTNICDLGAGIVYLYRFHNYEQVVRIDLGKELLKGPRVVELRSLFPESHAANFYQKGIEKTMAERLAKHAIVALDEGKAAMLVGEYGVRAGVLAGYRITVSLREHKLLAEIPSLLDATELAPVSATDYVLNGLEEAYSFKFTGDGAGGANRLAIVMMSMEVEAFRQDSAGGG
ncbi:MAG TPA: carcinine hydrolase/isopenicillin-N N-acyltransferase family protein [Candidatus Aminicenantes bacterium]|nr:carcinine hydrolase/isopenicillin-N N-acyltransferase family protein [Candidatus Aminicenantes bacterium]